MKLVIKLTPIATIASTDKYALQNKVSNYGIWTFTNHGCYRSPQSYSNSFNNDIDNDVAIVVNYQLVNKKTKQTKNRRTGYTSSVIIRKKLWTARVYRIPVSVLKYGGLRVDQKSWHFEFSKIK